MQKTIHTCTYHNNYWSNLRVTKNLRIVEISEKTGVPRGSLSNYFTGKCMPKDNVIAAICDVFEIDFETGKQAFYDGFMQYKPRTKTRGYMTNSEPRVELPEDPLANKVIKKYKKKAVAVTEKTSVKTKHETAWSKRLKTAGLTATEFAKYLGKEKSTVIKYVSGKNMPPKEVVQLFADYFKVPYVQAAEEFQIAYEQYNHIERKKPKKLADIDDTSSVSIPEHTVCKEPSKSRKLNKKQAVSLMKSLYGRIDAETFMLIVNHGKISDSKLRELYLNLDYDTFITLSKFLKE